MKLSECDKCSLSKIRARVVCGHPKPSGRSPLVAFIGQAPGLTEDTQGIPFIGRAGKLLRSEVSKIGLKANECYFSNIAKCYPGKDASGNDYTPPKEAIEACRPWLEKELKIVNPMVIVLVGGVALGTMLGFKKIGDKHGKPVMQGDRIYFPIYHPAAVLRGSYKREFEQDFLKLKEIVASLRQMKERGQKLT